MTKLIDRSEVSRALAKAIAYKQCGKDAKANQWAAHLIDLLDCAEILDFSLIEVQMRNAGEGM